MAETNDSLSYSFAVAVLAKREAIKRVKADLQARGIRLSYVSPRDVRIVADQYLAQHRAEIVAQVMETVRKAPQFQTLIEPKQRKPRKIEQCQTQHQQQKIEHCRNASPTQLIGNGSI